MRLRIRKYIRAREEKKRQAIDRKEAECCPSAIVQRAASKKVIG